MVYTLTLNPALDYVMKTERLRYDDINRSSNETFYCGGKGINVSVMLTRLGIRNTALGFTAGFTGAYLEERLKADGIDCDFIRLKHGCTRMNVKIKAETELDINASGPEVGEEELQLLTERLNRLASGDILVIAGSVPKNLPSDLYETIAKQMERKGVRLVIDAEGDLLLRTLKCKPFLIKPNHHELGDLFGVSLRTEEEILPYARELQKAGAQNVLVSRAKDGALLLDGTGRVYRTENAEGRLINSVGCGDSMVAGFLAGYLKYGDYFKALQWGTACGNATAYSEGLGEKETIDMFLHKHRRLEHDKV